MSLRSGIRTSVHPPSSNSSSEQNRVKNLWTQVANGGSHPFDLKIVCCGGQSLWCHRSVVAGCSTFLAELLQEPEVQARDGSWVRIEGRMEWTLLLDQVQLSDLRRLLCLLYNGFAEVTLNAAADLKEVWKHLRIDVVKLQQPQIDVVDQQEAESCGLGKEGRYFIESKPTKIEEVNTLEELVTNIKSEFSDLEDPNEDPDDPLMTPVTYPVPVKRTRGRPSNKKSSISSFTTTEVVMPSHPLTAKKLKTEGGGSYFVEQVHVCKICHGKDKDGKVDKEGMNLNFRDLKKLVGHYGKHLYDEGKVFKYVPLGPDNQDRGNGVDEFGMTYRYKCGFKSCWKSVKGECGYKEFALHMISDHDALEKALGEDERPELRHLLAQILQVKEQLREATQPRTCIFPTCRDNERQHTNENDYRTLKHHYATAHWRRWFEKPPVQGQPLRTQRLVKTGTICEVCKMKMFGDDERMIEHYAVVHDRLKEALLDVGESGVTLADTRAVVEQVMPSLLPQLIKKFGGARK